MAKPIARNAPCPCKSGKKYKQCCMCKTKGMATYRIPIILSAVGVVIGLLFTIQRSLITGIAVAAAIIIVVWIAVLLKNPPRSGTGGGDPSSINFGN